MRRAPDLESEDQSSVTRAELLAMKVSAILETYPRSLDVLIEHGFAPLRQPHLRAVLAHTVNLGQALRIRSLAADEERALLDELLALLGSTAVTTQAREEATVN